MTRLSSGLRILVLACCLLPAKGFAGVDQNKTRVATNSGCATCPLTDEELDRAADAVIFGKADLKTTALNDIKARGKTDMIAGLILGIRFRQNDPAIINTIAELTKSPIRSWRDALLWQEDHPEIKPHPSHINLKLKIINRLDPNFLRFLDAEKAKPENLKIRLEEIIWGGVPVDGIPSLDNPDLIAATEATYMNDDDLVFGVEINGDVRAYPLRIMGWHEMFNETIGGIPVALAYCTLCGAGILFETLVEGRQKPLIFGSSGFLFRSNKLMFDRESDSLWNQFTGEPVSGPLRNSGIKLKIRPVSITSWGKWRGQHPQTKVLSIETGHARDYSSGQVYKDYFASPDLMFPTRVRNENQLKRKDYIFGIRDFGAAKAWPINSFTNLSVINDQVGSKKIVLIGDSRTRTARAYERGEHVFNQLDDTGALTDKNGIWKISESDILGPAGERFPRIPGHVSYWFAWDGYLGVGSDLYTTP